MNSRIESFERDGYLIEFIAEGRKLTMLINGLPVANPRGYDKKAQLLSGWIIDTLKLPVAHKNSWRAIDDTLTAYGYTLAPAFAQRRGKVLHSIYVMTSPAPIPVEWPISRASVERQGQGV